MIYGLIVIIWLVCGFQILRHSGIKRLLYFFVRIFFVPATLTVIPISLLQGHSFYAFMFILSMLWHKEFKLQTFMSCPMFKSLMFIFVACLLIGLFDLRIGVFRGVFRGITNFINTYFLFFVGWTSFKIDDRIDGGISEQFLKKFLPITLIFTIFGLWSAFTKDNPILDAVGLEGRFLSEHMENYRTFRVTGFTVSSSVYGLACSVLFMSSYALMKNYSKVQIIAVVMLLLNIFLSATRAAIIPFLIGIIFFIILDKGISKIIKYTFNRNNFNRSCLSSIARIDNRLFWPNVRFDCRCNVSTWDRGRKVWRKYGGCQGYANWCGYGVFKRKTFIWARICIF